MIGLVTPILLIGCVSDRMPGRKEFGSKKDQEDRNEREPSLALTICLFWWVFVHASATVFKIKQSSAYVRTGLCEKGCVCFYKNVVYAELLTFSGKDI